MVPRHLSDISYEFLHHHKYGVDIRKMTLLLVVLVPYLIKLARTLKNLSSLQSLGDRAKYEEGKKGKI